MSSSSWHGIRPGSKVVSVYNEALLAYLWDESHLPVLQACGADFESGYAESDAEIEKPLKKLAKDGVLVAYELFQDDEVSLEVVVGPPLSKTELKNGNWTKPLTANLHLPSGVLRIDTANTLPVEYEQEEQPGRVNVPPGEYVISLYHLDQEKMGGEDWTGPQSILVLTPSAEAKPVKGSKALLRYGRLPEKWIGQYTITDGVFHGKAFARDAQNLYLINIDRPAAEKLDLTPGTMLRIEVGNFKSDVVYIGEIELPGKHKVRVQRGERTEFGIAFRMTTTFDDERDHKIVIERPVQTIPFPKLNQWLPATAVKLDQRFEGM